MNVSTIAYIDSSDRIPNTAKKNVTNFLPTESDFMCFLYNGNFRPAIQNVSTLPSLDIRTESHCKCKRVRGGIVAQNTTRHNLVGSTAYKEAKVMTNSK